MRVISAAKGLLGGRVMFEKDSELIDLSSGAYQNEGYNLSEFVEEY